MGDQGLGLLQDDYHEWKRKNPKSQVSASVPPVRYRRLDSPPVMGMFRDPARRLRSGRYHRKNDLSHWLQVRAMGSGGGVGRGAGQVSPRSFAAIDNVDDDVGGVDVVIECRLVSPAWRDPLPPSRLISVPTPLNAPQPVPAHLHRHPQSPFEHWSSIDRRSIPSRSSTPHPDPRRERLPSAT